MFIYSRNILQLSQLSAHAELFCQPIYWQSKSPTDNTESQIWNNVCSFSFLSFEKYVFRKLSFKSSDRNKKHHGGNFIPLLREKCFRKSDAVCKMQPSKVCQPRACSCSNLRRPQENLLLLVGGSAPAWMWGASWRSGCSDCTCNKLQIHKSAGNQMPQGQVTVLRGRISSVTGIRLKGNTRFQRFSSSCKVA